MRISIVGTVGVPANYGGFETLIENLLKYHDAISTKDSITVYCSSKSYPEKMSTYLSAKLRYIPFNANGAQSVIYDIFSLFFAVWNRSNTILLLGVSGAIALPFIQMVSSARIVTNIDGIEWRRKKWQGVAKLFLRLSEKIAVKFSDEVIADNAAIADYVRETYGVESSVIAYGGDHAVAATAAPVSEYALPDKFAFSVCRIEPENNVHLIVDAFSRQNLIALVMVGNWKNSEYGQKIRARYAACEHLFLLDPIYDLGKLKTLRAQAEFYIHGHSAGGTNPSLVEAMHFAKPIFAFDCSFNRATTEEKAMFFVDSDTLLYLINSTSAFSAEELGRNLQAVAQRRYTWNVVAEQYFSLLSKSAVKH